MYLNKKLKFIIFFAVILLNQLVASEEVSAIIWESSLPRSDFSNLIKLKEGEPYSSRDIRRTVKLLYATRLFEQIIVSREKTSNGKWIVTINGIPQLFISDVSIVGNRSLSDRAIKLAGGLRLNQPHYTHELEKIREEILFLYRDNGFFNCQVSIGTEIQSDNRVSINLHISEGHQARIKNIRFSGDISVSELKKLKYELERQFRNRPLIEKNVNDINTFMTEYFKEEGFLDVRVNISTTSDGTVAVSVNKGALYELIIDGVKSFSTGTIEEILTTVPNYYFNLRGVENRLLVFYQAYGFPYAKVAVNTHSSGGVLGEAAKRIIHVKIKENDRKFVSDVIFAGVTGKNRKILVSRIKDYLDKKIEEENFPLITINRSLTGGGYTDSDGKRVRAIHRSRRDRVLLPDPPRAIPRDYLDDIKTVVERVYRHEGYRDVEVLNVEFKEIDGELFLEIGVKENSHYTISKIGFETGDEELDRELRETVILHGNVPYSQRTVGIYHDRVEALLLEKGFIFSRVTIDKNFDENKVELTFYADFLFNVSAAEVVVSGNHLTHTNVIRRMIRIRQGDKLKGDTFTRSRRNLLQTGVFQSATIAFIDPEFPSTEKDIVVTVSEVERWKITPGIGVSTDDGFGLTGTVEWRNVLKTGFSSRLDFRISRKIELFMSDSFKDHYKSDFSFWDRIERKINLAFIFPDIYLRAFPLSAQLEAFHIHDIRSNGGFPYMIDKNGFHFSFFRRFNENYFLSTGVEIAYQIERDHIIDEQGEVGYTDFDRLIITPEIRGYIDYRSNIFFPVTGYKTSHKIFNRTSLYGRSGHYTQIENNFSLFLPLQFRQTLTGEMEPRDTFIFHSFFETAVIIKHSGELSSDDVLKLGGSTSIRGFAGDSLPPADKVDDNHQGRYYFFMRNEMRIKLVDKFYMISFLDLGNLWEDIRNIADNQLFRYSSGGGLTYVSPIGALSAQVGFNLSPKENESRWALHIFISNF